MRSSKLFLAACAVVMAGCTSCRPASNRASRSAPAWQARWIWCQGEYSPRNFYVYARKSFILAAAPRAATARCTADSRYKLYVNGRFVGRGPARCDPRRQYYERYDLRPYLRGGRNVIAALVHHFGTGTGQYVRGRGAFLFEADIQSSRRDQVLATDGSWRVMPAAAWDRASPRLGVQLGFQELFDARREPRGWNDIAFDDSAWQSARVIGGVGMMPWPHLVPRDIPMLREQEIFPRAVLDVGRVATAGPLFHFDLAATFRPNQDAVAYLYTQIHAPAPRAVEVRVAHDDGLKLWVNGVRVIRRHRHGGVVPDEARARVALRAGWNPILAKVDQGDGPWELYFRIVSVAGAAARDLTYSALGQPAGGTQWVMIGPFPNPRRGERIRPGFDAIYPPEHRVDFGAAYQGKDQTVRWRPALTQVVEPRDLSARMAMEAHAPLGGPLVASAGALLRADGRAAVVETSRDDGVYFTVDFGREVVGYPRLRVKGPPGGIIEMGYDESLDRGRVNPKRDVLHADRYVMRDGPQTYELFDKRGFRYMQITVRDCRGPVELDSVSLNFATYPVGDRGRFNCSDPLLNDIWRVGAYTVQLCMEDAYEDCPWRERAQWMGDVRVEALVNYCAFGDLALIRKCLRQIAQSQLPNGVTQACYPGSAGAIIPDFCAIWIGSLWDYYQHSGDAALLRELYPNVQRALAFFASHTDEHGLLNNVPYLVFIDWADVDKRGEVTALNCFYWAALRAAAEMARRVGDGKSGRDYDARATALAAAINQRLWSEQRGAYIDCRVGDQLSDRVSQQANALAVVFGIADRERARRALDYILDPTKPVVPMGSPYFSFYLQRALWASGRDETALRMIRERWGDLLRRGATTWWETWGSTSSHCHGWSSAPTYDLSADVLGITPAGPGYKKVRFAPHPVDVEYAQGTVPTPRGDIRAGWRRRADGGLGLTLALPKGLVAEVRLPKLGPKATVTLNGQVVAAAGKIETRNVPGISSLDIE